MPLLLKPLIRTQPLLWTSRFPQDQSELVDSNKSVFEFQSPDQKERPLSSQSDFSYSQPAYSGAMGDSVTPGESTKTHSKST